MIFNENSIREKLEQLGDGTTIALQRESPFTYTLLVRSPTFQGVEEAHRQAQVWSLLQEAFGDEQMRRIEYIFTESPDEQAA